MDILTMAPGTLTPARLGKLAAGLDLDKDQARFLAAAYHSLSSIEYLAGKIVEGSDRVTPGNVGHYRVDSRMNAQTIRELCRLQKELITGTMEQVEV